MEFIMGVLRQIGGAVLPRKAPTRRWPDSIAGSRSAVQLMPVALFMMSTAAMAQGLPLELSPDARERFNRMSAEAERTGLAEPFRGISTDGVITPGLFPIRATGVPTESVRSAAAAFLASLTNEQRARTTFPVDDPEWRRWMNQNYYARQGVGLHEVSREQRQAAFDLLRESLSVRGMELTRNIMRLNQTLSELTGQRMYHEDNYWLTVMGTPSANQPWGWQIDGHHLIINYFVLGDQVVMAPAFWGSEPVIARKGRYQGTVVLQDVQNAGLAFVNRLDRSQRSQAILADSKPGNNNLAEAFRDNIDITSTGIAGSALTVAQREALFSLIGLYVGNLRDGHAAIKMEEVRQHLDATHFSWIGGTTADSVFYYRVHSPVVLIEFDHQRPIALGNRNGGPDREHIHVVLRTPNGNDYGADLLRQHYERHPHSHHHPHSHD